jgi:hypothetical protein
VAHLVVEVVIHAQEVELVRVAALLEQLQQLDFVQALVEEVLSGKRQERASA